MTRSPLLGSTSTRRAEPGTPPEAADKNSPDGWEANHAVLAHLAEHRIRHRV